MAGCGSDCISYLGSLDPGLGQLGLCGILKLDAAMWIGDAEMICHKLKSLSFLKT